MTKSIDSEGGRHRSRAPLVISLVLHGVLALSVGVLLVMRSEIPEIVNALDMVWLMTLDEPVMVKKRLKVPVRPQRLDPQQPVALRDPDRLMKQARNRIAEAMRLTDRIVTQDVDLSAPIIDRLPDVATIADVPRRTDVTSVSRARGRPGPTDGNANVTGRTRARGSGLGSLLYGNQGQDGLLGGGGRPGIHDPLNIIDFLRGRGSSGRIVYVLDVSSSMGAAGLHKLDLAKKSLLDHLYLLKEEESFNVITFSSRVSRMWAKLAPATSDNLSTANAHLAKFTQMSIMDNRGTDTLGALQAALTMRPDVVVLMTDGVPTSSQGKVVEYDPDRIVQLVRAGNRSNAALFIVGLEIDGLGGPGALLLRQLAEQTGGRVKFVGRDDLLMFSDAVRSRDGS